MCYKLEKPYTEKERANFIIRYNHDKGLIISETSTALYALEPWEKLEGEAIIDNTEEYQQEQIQREAEYTAMLYRSTVDIERAIYKAKGVDFDDIISYLKTQPLVDVKAFKIELKASGIRRSNPCVDIIGTILGLSKAQLDEFFKTNDYKELLT